MRKIKNGDEIIVISGKDKGKKGIVTKIINKYKKVLALVEGINLVKKHKKSNPNKNNSGGIVSSEMYIDYSNISIVNKNTGKKDKVSFKILDDNKKVRIYKSNGEVID